MNNIHQYCVILAGGFGARFWPISREERPKQFLELPFEGKSLLRLTYERMLKVVDPENIIVVSLERYAGIISEQIPELPSENILLEPYKHNTAPSIAFAAQELQKRDPESVMIVTPADHIIKDTELFARALSSAMDSAGKNPVLLTLGIKPTRPDTNFGYIQIAGGEKSIISNVPAKAKSFTEKPDPELAKVFFESREFLWNSGIFVWQTSVILDEIGKYMPSLKKTSIDYAVLEKSDKVWIIPVDFEWADLGSWTAAYEYVRDRKPGENVVLTAGKSLAGDNSDSLIVESVKNKLIAVKGLENFVVVDTDDVLLICPKDDAKLKELTAEISMPDFEEYR